MPLDIPAIEQQFWPNGSNRSVWMILDGARDRRIYSDLLNSHLIYSCLYSGDLAYDVEVAAPYLVQLEYEDQSTRGFIKRSWGQSWGVFLRCDARMDRLRRHLRTMLMVKTWRGERLLFRYYDPRVLRVYLPTCTSEELKTVFGPIQQFYAENESATSLMQFDFVRGKLAHSEVTVTASDLTASNG
jgi:hypothetical protein